MKVKKFKKYIFLFIFSLVIFYDSTAFSSPIIIIGNADILPGGETNLSIHLNNNNQSCAGVNVQLILPQGLSIQSVNKGDLLSDRFQIYWRSFDSDNNTYVNIITYASDDTIQEINGSLFEIVLTVADQFNRHHIPIKFSNNDHNSKVNLSHAISNSDGSQSIEHNVVSGLLRVDSFVWGDLNCDKEVKVEDAIIALKMMCGLISETPDIQRIGLEEAIYILKKSAY